MTEHKHTPGPWRAECEKWPLVRDGNKWWRVYAGESDMVAEIGRTADANSDEIAEDAANAQLVAAAPDMHAALTLVADKLEYLQGLWGKERITDGIADAVRSALVKATTT